MASTPQGEVLTPGAPAPPPGRLTDAELDEVRLFRAESARTGAALPRAMASLPTGTYERVAVEGAPVDELVVYRPRGVASPPPVLVSLHGGGFVLGSWQDDDPYCRHLADTAGCAVVTFDYPLAPEHPFPAAVHQTYDLLVWLAAHGGDLGLDTGRLAVGGHSAGGNLATAAALLAARRGGPALQGLVVDYAPLDLVPSPASKLAADADPGAVELASAGARFDAWYLPDAADAADELASPLRSADLSGLPATLVVTAGLDLLAPEGRRFAARLAEAGVPTEHHDAAGCGHGFTHAGPEDAARAAWARMAAFLRRALAGEGDA